MTINVIDRIAPLGSFPICSDADLLGGFRAVADTTARDAIPAADRSEGMWVFTTGTLTLYRLGAGLTNGDWVVVPLSASAVNSFRTSFVDGDLVAGVLTVNHALGQKFCQVEVYDNSDNLLGRADLVTATDANNLDIDFSSIQTAYGGAIPGTWNVVVIG